MTWTYLFCLIAGGVLITLSIAGDSDVPDGDGVTGIAEGGNPAVLFSTSFWSFSMAGFGLCGLLLQLFTDWPYLRGFVLIRRNAEIVSEITYMWRSITDPNLHHQEIEVSYFPSREPHTESRLPGDGC